MAAAKLSPKLRDLKRRLLIRTTKRESCWEWRGNRIGNGYGVLRFDGGVILAHRAAWLIARGTIKKGMCICHQCDNRICVRPSHLFIGTLAENLHDMWNKGRGSPPPHYKGSLHHKAKLTESDVRRIRARWKRGRSTAPEIAADYAVHKRTIWGIVLRESWRHV